MACNSLMSILAKIGMKIQNKPTNLYWKANHLQPSPVWTSFCLRAGFLGRESRPTSTIHHSKTYAYHSYRKWFCIFWRKIGHIGGKLMWSDFAWVAQWTVNECLHRVSEKCCVSYSDPRVIYQAVLACIVHWRIYLMTCFAWHFTTPALC